MSASLFRRLQQVLGDHAVDADAAGVPRAVPDQLERAAEVLALAHAEGWRVRIEGQGTWMPVDAPADLALTTRGLGRVTAAGGAEGLLRAEAGASFEEMRRAAGDLGLWLPLDPPGRPERSAGSVVATATTGPLRVGAGLRELVAGIGLVTGDGRLVESPAGGDGPRELPRLACGSFGAAGLITWVEFRLRPVPRADRTFLVHGARDRLTEAARALAAEAVETAAAELLSPAWAAEPEWTLAVRLAGDADEVSARADRLPGTTNQAWDELPAARCGAFWAIVARAPISAPVTLRVGALPDGLDETIDLVADQLDEGLVSAGAIGGGLRWAGNAVADRLRALRGRAVGRELPLTLERGPWELRNAIGHAGAYREGGAVPLERLRDEFDPDGTLVVAGGA
jgi:glycolate oxidase FAD binding subunit